MAVGHSFLVVRVDVELVAVNVGHLPLVLIDEIIGVEVDPFVLKSCQLHILDGEVKPSSVGVQHIVIELNAVGLSDVVFVFSNSSAEILVEVFEEVLIEQVGQGHVGIALVFNDSIPDVVSNKANAQRIKCDLVRAIFYVFSRVICL